MSYTPVTHQLVEDTDVVRAQEMELALIGLSDTSALPLFLREFLRGAYTKEQARAIKELAELLVTTK